MKNLRADSSVLRRGMKFLRRKGVSMMGRKSFWVGLLSIAVGLMFLQPPMVQAVDFPKKPISLIIPYAAGGSTDVLARALAKASGKHFPVQVMVVNQPGGAGIPGRVNVVNAKPDGYTLLFGYGSGEDLVTPHTMKIPYDQFKDLVPVCQISIVSLILSVPAAHPAKSLKEFVE
jgi:tripartite-type tricarboxylate transporter receptor subunit TctC